MTGANKHGLLLTRSIISLHQHFQRIIHFDFHLFLTLLFPSLPLNYRASLCGVVILPARHPNPRPNQPSTSHRPFPPASPIPSSYPKQSEITVSNYQHSHQSRPASQCHHSTQPHCSMIDSAKLQPIWEPSAS
ncbi:hypothetical protein EX30DRAFT_183720 [Ascodesmis nigricans]|uniref:Uncharacterized protein n=1 Tax=Ascodesmis nigricans TaxID=341454 RepID=A0A4S2N0F5_9PEZI|nr:hypothetical protein EX30DRAFT_183720 [Ascodesmis nigricans]